MSGYIQINLKDIIDELGEDRTKAILADFSCPANKDVEYFLKQKSIEFSKQGLASTFLVFTSYKKQNRIVGYYALATKTINIKKNILSKTLQKRVAKFCQHNSALKLYTTAAPLIAQLGKNYTDDLNKQITGDELLKMACDQVQFVQRIIGGKIVYLECEDNLKLKEFYEANGFVEFGRRHLDRDEEQYIDGHYLLQMLKYF